MTIITNRIEKIKIALDPAKNCWVTELRADNWAIIDKE